MTYDGRTRVLVKARPEPGAVELTLRPLPALAAGEALVRVRHAGICGTDLHIVGWNAWAARAYAPPFALGHELCGEIVDLASGVAPFAIGDRVTAETHLPCGRCRACRTGDGHVCLALRVFSRLDRGAFADYTVLPAALLRRVPDGVPDAVGAVMEPLGIAVRAVGEAAVAGRDLLVSGCGPIGLMAIAAARALGAAQVIASDPVAARRRLALAAGADVALDPAAGAVAEAVRERTGGIGVDAAVETSGSAAGLAAALRATATTGTVVVAGLPDADVPVDVAGQVVLREIVLKGIYGRRLDRSWVDTERALAGALDVAPLITHRFPLDDFDTALATAASGEAGKALFDVAPRVRL